MFDRRRTGAVVGKGRMASGMGGLTKKTGWYLNKSTGERTAYTYYQVSKEVPADRLPAGMDRKRITGSGRNAKEAARRCTENYDAYINGEGRRGKTRLSGRITVQKLFEEWDQANRDGLVTETMSDKYKGYFKNHVLPHIGERRVDALTGTELLLLFNQTLVAKTRKDGQPLLGGPARRNVYMALSGFFTWAVEQHYINANPLTAVKAPSKGVPNDDIDRVLVDSVKVLTALQERDNPDEARFLLAFLGLRRSERLGLCWADVQGLDSSAPKLKVHQQLAREKGKGLYLAPFTKSRVPRTITLAEPWIGALKRHKARQDVWKASSEWHEPKAQFADMLFLQPNGFPIDQNDDNDDWKELLNSLGVQQFRAHLLRHVTAIWLAEQPSTPISTVMAVLGHSSKAMSIYYAHVDSLRQVAPIRAYGKMLKRAAAQTSK